MWNSTSFTLWPSFEIVRFPPPRLPDWVPKQAQYQLNPWSQWWSDPMVSVDVDESMPWQKACNFLDFVSFNTPQVRRDPTTEKNLRRPGKAMSMSMYAFILFVRTFWGDMKFQKRLETSIFGVPNLQRSHQVNFRWATEAAWASTESTS